MFGLGAGFWLLILVVVLVPVALNAYREYTRTAGKEVSLGRADRRCLACGYQGRMKTWLGNYSVPQFIALLGFLFFFIPGLIFIAIISGKYKCPSCGTIGKNQPLSDASQIKKADQLKTIDQDTHPCPYCAETIKKAAVICRYCQRALSS